MRRACRTRAIIVAIVAAVWCAVPAVAEDLRFPRDHHPWGHFPVGSSKRVRTIGESLDEKGNVISVTVTETKSTIVAADEASYTLRTDSTVEVAAQRITAAPQTTQYGYYGESAGQTLGVKRAADVSLSIDGRTIPCDVRQVSLASQSGKLTSTMYYSSQRPPFVLRRETSVEGISLEGAPDEKRNTSLVEVVALDLPQRVRGELKPANYVKTTQTLPQGSKVTLEVHCDDVPGGVVAHWSSETDATGRVVRRSTLELIDFSVAAAPASVQPTLIRRPLRAGRATRRMDPR